LITKYSHGNTGIKAKNSVLKQAKMVSIYQKTIQRTPQRDSPITPCKFYII
jgi:hypothetical protein